MGIRNVAKRSGQGLRWWIALATVLGSLWGAPLQAEETPAQPQPEAAGGAAEGDGTQAADQGAETGADEEPASEDGGTAAPVVHPRPGYDVPRAMVNPEWNLLEGLAREVRGGEFVRLGQDGPAAPALYWPAVAEKNEGGALILVPVGEGWTVQGLTARLAARLPEAGWHALMVGLADPVPAIPDRVLPAKVAIRPKPADSEAEEDAADEGDGSTASDETANNAPAQEDSASGSQPETGDGEQPAADKAVDIDVAKGEGSAAEGAAPDASPTPADGAVAEPVAKSPDNAARLALAFDELLRRGLANTAVIALETGVPAALAGLAARPEIPERGLVLVLVNARFADWQRWTRKQPQLNRLAVLDIYDRDRSELVAQARLRQQSARRLKFARYDVYPMSAPGLGRGSERLARKVTRWLLEVAPGEDRILNDSGGA